MVLRRNTIDNSVKYTLQSEQTKERDIKPNTIKNNSKPGKRNKNISQNSKKKLPKKISASGLKPPK